MRGLMNKGWLSAAVLTASASIAPAPLADGGSTLPASYYVSAPVVDVDPIYVRRTVENPIRHCTEERVHRHDYRPRREDGNYFVPGIVGGIVGGLIGNQFGGGSGKKALTIAGAIAGSSIARDAARQHRQQPQEVCHTSYQTEVVQSVTAYDVTYEYADQLFEKRMTEHPGSSVRVRVALEPAIGET